MSRRTAGICLIFTAAFLYAVRYLSAAIFGAGVASWSEDLFQAMFRYVGSGLSVASTFALIAGIAYLVWAEVEAFRSKKQA